MVIGKMKVQSMHRSTQLQLKSHSLLSLGWIVNYRHIPSKYLRFMHTSAHWNLIMLQVFSINEGECISHWNKDQPEDRPSTAKLLADVTQRRLTIAKLLLKAGACPTVKGASFTEDCILRLQWLAEKNPNSGGPDDLDRLVGCIAEPRTLMSSCRLAVRRCFQRPICLDNNVKVLPIPEQIKRYIAMDEQQHHRTWIASCRVSTRFSNWAGVYTLCLLCAVDNWLFEMLLPLSKQISTLLQHFLLIKANFTN